MESDFTQSAWFYKSWAWFEAHKKQVAWVLGAVLVLGFVMGFLAWRNNDRQVTASEALSRVISSGAVTGEPPTAEAFLNVAAEHPDTAAAGRAMLIAAARLFAEGKFAEAQTQFETFLRKHGSSPFAGQAHLGVAACLDASGKTNEAIAAYKQIAERRSTDLVAPQARLSLARLYAAQGNLKLARDTYQQLARSEFGSVGQEAGMHLEDLLGNNPELALPDSMPVNVPAPVPLEPATNTAAE